MKNHTSNRLLWLKTAVVADTFFILVALALPNYSYARQWIGLTGIELAEKHNAYRFVGAITPLASDAEFGQGWVQSYWLDWVEYRFDSDGEQVQARAPGFSASLGYQQSNSTGYWAAYVGAGYRKTTLTPDRPAAEVRGSKSALLLLAEVDRRITRSWRFAGIAQLAAGPDSYWTRAKFLHATSTSVWQGIEIVFQGDPDYHATKIGLVLDEWPVSKRISANFKLGAVKAKDLKTGAYVGVEFVGTFGSSK